MMFHKVFGDRLRGLIADTDPSFVAKDWYKSSRGFRTVFGELTSFFYARLFFSPDKEAVRNLIIHGKYIDGIQNKRYENDRYFNKKETSPLSDSGLLAFKGLQYFPIDRSFRIQAKIAVDTSKPAFKMPTSTDRLPAYRQYAILNFLIHDSLFQLTAYQNLDLLKKDPKSKYLFVPFKDYTNNTTTYGGGRYMDIEMTDNDSIILDFNLCYNPYCAYADRWSCPIPPFENHLQTSITAGEKKFH